MADERGQESHKKLERKYARKLKKCLKALEKFEVNISPSEDPTNILFIGNGGVLCGFDCEQLYNIFERYGPLQDLVLIPDRPYSFVIYQDVQSAKEALTHFQNRLQNPLYLQFSNKVPDVSVPFDGNVLPPGLTVIEDFVSLEEEGQLATLIPQCDQTLKSRRVQHFGYEFDYSTNNRFGSKKLKKQIPTLCDKILSRILSRGFLKDLPDQLTINHYLPGQGIPPHVDTHSAFKDGIVSLSLGSQVVMEFRDPSGRHVPMHLPARSLLVMKGESRYVWSHGITCRKNDIIPMVTATGSRRLSIKARLPRTSFTFRKVTTGSCQCDFKEYCDRKESDEPDRPNDGQETLQLEEKSAENLERIHVHKVYENIADHFSDTRYKPWPKISAFLDSLTLGTILYDIGCGNGKYLGRHSDMFQVGCDMSNNLLKICRSRQLEVVEADVLSLPFRPGTADALLCIAVLHHLATKERRQRGLHEMSHLLRVGGEALIYVWALEQQGPEGPSNYLKQQQSQQPNPEVLNVLNSVALPVHVNRTPFAQQDMLVPWKSLKNSENQSGVFHRFYHMFEENELRTLVEHVECLEVVENYYDKGNWCIRVKKVTESVSSV